MEFWYLTNTKGDLVKEGLAGLAEFYSPQYIAIIEREVAAGNILHKVPVKVIVC